MISRPSPRTQRVYGVSFSVANFLANSSETTAFLAIPCSSRFSTGAARGQVPQRDALLGTHANVDFLTDRRPEGGVGAGEQYSLTQPDLKIDMLAEKDVGVDDRQAQIARFVSGRLLVELDVFRPHR